MAGFQRHMVRRGHLPLGDLLQLSLQAEIRRRIRLHNGGHAAQQLRDLTLSSSVVSTIIRGILW